MTVPVRIPAAARPAQETGYRHTKALIVLLCSSLAFTNAKLAGLQPADGILLALLALCASKFIVRGFKVSLVPVVSTLGRRYCALFLLLLCFEVADLRLPNFPLQGLSVLKAPLILPASKYIQFGSVVCGFLWLTDVLWRDVRLLRLAVKIYWWTGLLSCAYACLSYVVLRGAHVDLLGAYDLDGEFRARGFFNEGGPFGIYVVSVVLMGMLRSRLTGRRLGVASWAVCLAAFLLSQSRAGFFFMSLLFLLSILTASSFRKRISYLAVATVAIGATLVILDVPRIMAAYLASYQNIEYTVATASELDPNLVLGRVAGSYIVPRMIRAHPITGIGVGNYSVMRNDPHYLGSLPDIRWFDDLPGLGLLGDTAELGIPATVLLVLLLLFPYRRCSQKSSIVGSVAIFQLGAHLFGVHLNFFYPWCMSALALAAERHISADPLPSGAPARFTISASPMHIP